MLWKIIGWIVVIWVIIYALNHPGEASLDVHNAWHAVFGSAGS